MNIKKSFSNRFIALVASSRLLALLLGFTCFAVGVQAGGLKVEIGQPQSGPWLFAQSDRAELTITNSGDSAVLVGQVDTSGNSLKLSGPAYGSLAATENGISLNTMSQRATQVDLHRGLLLPGQSLKLSLSFMPLARTETVTLSVLTKPPLEKLLMQTEAAMPIIQYGPFDRKVFAAENGNNRQPALGPGTDPGTLVPKDITDPFPLEGFTVQTFPLKFVFDEEAFPREPATSQVQLILGQQITGNQLVWCPLLEAWVVLDTERSWLLKSKTQKKPGKGLPLAPAAFWQDLSGENKVLVRVAEAAPAKVLEGEKPVTFWRKFEVKAGDGMYTHGSFILLDSDNALAFLKKAKKEKAVLWQVDYYFTSRYFQLEVPED